MQTLKKCWPSFQYFITPYFSPSPAFAHPWDATDHRTLSLNYKLSLGWAHPAPWLLSASLHRRLPALDLQVKYSQVPKLCPHLPPIHLRRVVPGIHIQNESHFLSFNIFSVISFTVPDLKLWTDSRILFLPNLLHVTLSIPFCNGNCYSVNQSHFSLATLQRSANSP